MPKEVQSKTGNAQIVRQGHTSDSQHGSNPQAQGFGRKPVRDLSAK